YTDGGWPVEARTELWSRLQAWASQPRSSDRRCGEEMSPCPGEDRDPPGRRADQGTPETELGGVHADQGELAIRRERQSLDLARRKRGCTFRVPAGLAEGR